MKTYQDLTAPERLAYRKKREICSKLNALKQEFDLWLKRSEPGEPFEKHHTQVRALRAHLGQWNKRVDLILRENLRAEANEFLASIYNAEQLMLSEHRIWEYFRSKFIQRNENQFRTYLRVADEFAWACYKPIQESVFSDPLDAARKEPPLVFFNGGTSPFSMSRGKTFEPEIVEDEPLSSKEIETICKLPVPVVGIPWHQINHLPEALVIGHEVGHIIEDDFGLTGRLHTLLGEAITKAKAEKRHDPWKSWLGEIFADIYGCLCTGPSFAGALMDFFARDYAEIPFERRTEKQWGLYPTIYLRGQLVLETLDQIGFSEDAKECGKLWAGLTSKMPEEFSHDIPFIVSKLLDGKLLKTSGAEVENKSLKEVFCFSAKQQEQVLKALFQLNNNITLASVDARVLLAAIRKSYEDNPKRFIAKNYNGTMLTHFEREVIKPGIRAGESRLTGEQISKKEKMHERLAQEIIKDFLTSIEPHSN